jgi:hypothetical protein
MKSNSPTHEDISRRAQELWEERGRPEGRDTEIWLDAERELSTPTAAANSPSRVQGRGNGNSQRSETETAADGADPIPTADSPAQHPVGAPGAQEPAAKFSQQKKDARAPKTPAKNAPRPTPPESGKPLWDKPHSS